MCKKYNNLLEKNNKILVPFPFINWEKSCTCKSSCGGVIKKVNLLVYRGGGLQPLGSSSGCGGQKKALNKQSSCSPPTNLFMDIPLGYL